MKPKSYRDWQAVYKIYKDGKPVLGNRIWSSVGACKLTMNRNGWRGDKRFEIKCFELVLIGNVV